MRIFAFEQTEGVCADGLLSLSVLFLLRSEVCKPSVCLSARDGLSLNKWVTRALEKALLENAAEASGQRSWNSDV
jgi:predicted HicB family RNase H-like nuclease